MPPKTPPNSRPARRKPLTAAEWRFIQEYVNNGGNATRAMQVVNPRLTYSSARSRASRTLNKVNVRRAVARETGRRFRKRGTTADRVLGEWEAIAYAHVGEVIDVRTGELLADIPPAALRAVAQLEITPVKVGRHVYSKVKVRMHPKGEALDRICRHLGLYRELPPLETVLNLLPPHIAAGIRDEIARGVPADAGGPADDPLPDWAKPVPEADADGGLSGDPEPGVREQELAALFAVGEEPERGM